MRILLLTLYYAPDPAANSVIMSELARRLGRAGHQVTVVCAFPHYDRNRIWSAYRCKLVQHERADNIDVYRVWLYLPKQKTNSMGRLLSYISFHVMSTFVGAIIPRPDVILAPSPPLSIGISAWLLGLLHRAPYVYNVQDIYPDVAIRLGTLTKRGLIAFFSWLERFIYHRAAAVSVISEGFRRNLLHKGVPGSQIAVIPNFVDAGFVSPRSRDNAFARCHDLVDRFVVLFAGNVGLSQGLEHVLRAAQLLSDDDDIVFLIVGDGSTKPALQEQAARLGLQNVRFFPFQPREDVPNLYGTADVCLVPLRKGVAYESVPSKALTIMAAGRPVIASVDVGSDTWELVGHARCGLCVPPEDPQALAAAIRTFSAEPGLRESAGRKGREYVTKHYTPDRVAQLYHDLFGRLA